MVTFREITNKTLSVNYTKADVEGYKVVGNVTYNKENKIVNADGDIRDAEDKRIAFFNTYGEGENARINLTDCMADKMAEAAQVANATLADLAQSYPQE